ncbi:MAG: hypothetical protein HY866_04295 [Chloroflexi bacterium]|nr:hypothetical protein [Chloroflexota bacterium]
MFSFKRSVLFVTASVLALVIGFGFSARTSTTRAQDDMELVTCDSTLVTLLYIAEYDYGFHSMYDVSTLDKGQYAPLFEAMMAMMESDETMMEATPEGEMMESTPEESMMDDMTTMLMPGTIEGEDQFCTDLRAELDAFFYAALTEEMMMGE